MPETPPENDHRWKAALTVFLAAPVLFLASGGGGPLFSDEGSLLLIGHGIANGRFLYDSYINEKPPALFLLSSLFMRKNPVESLLWYRFAIAFLAGAVAAFYAWKISSGNRILRGSITGAGILLSFAFHLGFQWSPNSLIALATLLLPALLGENNGNRHLAAAGAIAGFLLFARFQNLPLALATLACVGRSRERLGSFLTGFSIFAAAVFAFLAATGTLTGFWNHAIVENTRSGGLPAYAFAFGSPLNHLVLIAGIMFLFAASARMERRPAFLNCLLVLLAGALLSAAPRFDHQRLLAASVLLVLAMASLATERPPLFRRAAMTLFTAGLLLTSLRLVMLYPALESQMTGRREVADYLNSSPPPGRRIAVMPHEPYIHLLSDLEPVSPRYFLLPWRSTPAMQKELTDALEQDGFPPIVDMTLAGAAGAPHRLENYAASFSAFRRQHYRLGKTFGSGIQVWLRSDSTRDSR